MGFRAKIRNRSLVTRGRAKQRIGRATHNRRLQAEGLAERIGGSARQVGERAKDAGKDVMRAFRR
jgi:uncharacterized protein YjbJ (UPF0337 family)